MRSDAGADLRLCETAELRGESESNRMVSFQSSNLVFHLLKNEHLGSGQAECVLFVLIRVLRIFNSFQVVEITGLVDLEGVRSVELWCAGYRRRVCEVSRRRCQCVKFEFA